jgi:hypothetical protein
MAKYYLNRPALVEMDVRLLDVRIAAMQEQLLEVRDSQRATQESQRGVQEQLKELRDSQKVLTTLLSELARNFSTHTVVPTSSTSLTIPSSAGNSPLTSPVANLHGISLRPPSIASSAASSMKSAHSGTFSFLSLFILYTALIICLIGVRASPMDISGGSPAQGSTPALRAASVASSAASSVKSGHSGILSSQSPLLLCTTLIVCLKVVRARPLDNSGAGAVQGSKPGSRSSSKGKGKGNAPDI